MTEYLDELILIFRKARPGTKISYQDEEVRNCLLAGLPTEALIEIDGYLDLTATEITQKYDVIHSQRDTLGSTTLVAVEKPLLAAQEKQTGGDDPHTYSEFEQFFAFRYRNHQNKFKDETCTYCNRKGHTEVVCFIKHDDDKLTKMAAPSNKLAMDSILDRLNKMHLKG